MGVLRFSPDDVKKVWEHAKACKHWRKVWGEERHEPYLTLVHDQGVYLMSPGIPHLERPGAPERSWVAYARGCSPADNDWYSTSQDLVGGDDFAEELSIDVFDTMFDAYGDRLICVEITMTNEHISIGCRHKEAVMPTKKKKRKPTKAKAAKKKRKALAPAPGIEW
jgi:hypothetical protein